MIYDTKLAEFKTLIGNIEYLKYTLNSLIYWDKLTNMPKDAIEYRSKTMAFLADQQYQMMSSDKFEGYLRYFDGNPKNNNETDAMIYRIKRSSNFINRIPEDEYGKYIKLIAVSEQAWEKSKSGNHFNAFKPYLKEIVKTFKSFTKYWGYDENSYDALLGYYEDNLTVKSIDKWLEEVKTQVIPLIEKIKETSQKEDGKANKKIIIKGISEEKQKAIWEMILKTIGFNFDSGRVDVGAHPTILANSPNDVRIVNTYSSDDLMVGIFNVLHSGGKGVYQQSISKDLLGTFMAEPPSFAMEEAIGRFYENIIGRNRSFWEYVYPKMVEIAPELERYTVDEIFTGVNTVEPSLIRIESDELTNLIHIIIRYEIEKDLVNDVITVDDLPKVWSDKYEEYLGLRPSNDSEGVLQDIHWAAGYFGYFPSYIISSLFATQLASSIEREEGSLDQLMAKGDFDRIKAWLTDNLFKHGATYITSDLIEMSTDERLNADYYIDYLRKKYSEVYRLF